MNKGEYISSLSYINDMLNVIYSDYIPSAKPYVLNLGKYNFIEIQVCDPRLFGKVENNNPIIYFASEAGRKKDFEIAKRFKNSEIMERVLSIDNSIPSLKKEFIVQSINKKDLSDLLFSLLVDIYGFRQNQKLYYNYSHYKEDLKEF